MRHTPFIYMLIFGLASWTLLAAQIPREACTPEETLVTHTKSVDLGKIFGAIEAIRHFDGTPLGGKLSDETRDALAKLFGPGTSRTKMDQFYRMLFILSRHYQYPPSRQVEFSGESVAQVLREARVITNPHFLANIEKVRVTWREREDPLYEVFYHGREAQFPLNEGRGFSIWRHGKCQVTQALLFHNPFSFKMFLIRPGHNLLVYDFRGVDLVGDFGVRSRILNLDLRYITLLSVEFIEGTVKGKVKAHISRKELETTTEKKFFKMLGRLFPNTSMQPIDW